jgi:uncharacterized protein YegP (UPF0339 family)
MSTSTKDPVTGLAWEFYRDSATLWRWRAEAPNNRIVGAATQGYHNYSDCSANAATLGNGTAQRDQYGRIITPASHPALYTWTVYEKHDAYGKLEHRWHVVAKNGNIIGASSEAYTHRTHCVENARLFGYIGA